MVGRGKLLLAPSLRSCWTVIPLSFFLGIWESEGEKNPRKKCRKENYKKQIDEDN